AHLGAGGAGEGGAGHVVDHAERGHREHVGGGVVGHVALAPVAATPGAVRPGGVAAVAGSGVERHVPVRGDVERERRAVGFGEVDGGTGRDAGAGLVADGEAGPAELVDLVGPLGVAVPHAHGVVEDA